MDLKRGELVGERTFGEGSVQKTMGLQNGAALLLTVAKYQTASGKKIQDVAVTPNELIGKPASDEEDEEEAAPAKTAPVKGEQPKTDEFLNKALQLLKAK
jgi:carboxyl-terminal processing protease